MDDFGRALAGADVVVMTDIYAAGEDPIPGVTLEALANTVRAQFDGELHLVPALGDVPARLAAVARRDDLIV